MIWLILSLTPNTAFGNHFLYRLRANDVLRMHEISIPIFPVYLLTFRL